MSSTAKGKSSKGHGTFKTPLAVAGQKRVLLVVGMVYVCCWLAYVTQSAVGSHLTGPEDKLLEQAYALAQGHVAIGGISAYTAFLSLLTHLAPSTEQVIFLARFVNVVAFIATLVVCIATSRRYWGSNRAIWITGLLVGLNPVAVFWTTTVGPATLASLSLTLAASRTILWLRGAPDRKTSLIISSALTIAALLELALTPLLAIWPIIAWSYTNKAKTHHLLTAIGAPVIAAGLIFLTPINFSQPVSFDISQFGYHLYASFHSFEGFDGQSYSLQKQLHPLLLFNPIHWGLLLLCAVSGMYARFKWGTDQRSILYVSAVAFIIAVSFSLFGEGSQSRSILHPLLAILAGGLVFMPKVFKKARRKTKRRFALATLLLGTLLYVDPSGAVRGESHWENDYAYLAKAHLAAGQNTQASDWATKALELNNNLSEMHSIRTFASFNQWAFAQNPKPLSVEACKNLYTKSARADQSDPEIHALTTLYDYKLRNIDQSIVTWNEISKESALAYAFLFWTGNGPAVNPEVLETFKESPYLWVLEEAASINRNHARYTEAQQMIDNLLAFAF